MKMQLSKEMTSHLVNRKKMFWKENKTDGKLISLKVLNNKQLMIAKAVIEKYSTDTNQIWYGYSKENWLKAINWELYLRNKKIDLVIKSCLNYLPLKAPKRNLVVLKECNNLSNIPMNNLLKSLII